LPETAAALKDVSTETENDASAAPMLRAAAICARLAGAALSPEDAELADLASFCDEVPVGLQRKITHAVEAAAHADGIAADERPMCRSGTAWQRRRSAASRPHLRRQTPRMLLHAAARRRRRRRAQRIVAQRQQR
jgi:hypothetical protein